MSTREKREAGAGRNRRLLVGCAVLALLALELGGYVLARGGFSGGNQAQGEASPARFERAADETGTAESSPLRDVLLFPLL